MKRIAAVLVLVFCFSTFAEVSLGINLGTSYQNDHRNDNQNPEIVTNDRGFGFSFYPSVIIAPSDMVEFVPYAGFYVNKSWGETKSDGDVTSDYNNTPSHGVGFGAGVFFRLVNREIITTFAWAAVRF